MSNGSISNDMALTHNVANESNPRSDLTLRLLAQLLYNNANPEQPRTYMHFPSDHSGHLNLEHRIRFVSIIRSSNLADNYRFGSSLGTIYMKNTYRYPIITASMIGAVLQAESASN